MMITSNVIQFPCPHGGPTHFTEVRRDGRAQCLKCGWIIYDEQGEVTAEKIEAVMAWKASRDKATP